MLNSLDLALFLYIHLKIRQVKEDFLHFIWLHKKLDFSNLKTTSGETITVLSTGSYTQQAGPDFFNAKIEINNQVWAGNIEMHVKSSDWYLHNHQNDDNYNNVILHVVWEHDTVVFYPNNKPIPVLELKNQINKALLTNYLNLKTAKNWIFCENDIKSVTQFTIANFKEKLLIERLQQKEEVIKQLLVHNKNDFNASFFVFLAKNFGLNSNGRAFEAIANHIGFNVFQKEQNNLLHLEALLFGFAGLLNGDFQDQHPKDLQQTFLYLKQKHQLKDVFIQVNFFKHRPDNFPTIRLAQLAQLYFLKKHLFEHITSANSPEQIHKILNVQVSEYWETHYIFDQESKNKVKKTSNAFLDLLLINAVLPIRFAYQNYLGEPFSDSLLEWLKNIKPEQNSIIKRFDALGFKSISSYDTQAFIHLKKKYCDLQKCLSCAIGSELIKNT